MPKWVEIMMQRFCSKISQSLEVIQMEHIEPICSSKSQLCFGSIQGCWANSDGANSDDFFGKSFRRHGWANSDDF